MDQSQWLTGRKRGKDGNTKFWISQEWKKVFRWNKNILHSFWRAIIWLKIKMKVVQLNALFLTHAIFTQRSWELGWWENTTNYTVALFIFLWHTAQESILDKLIMTELMWKSTLICAALEDQFVKSEVYKPNCKSLPVKSSEKVFMLCIWIWENELSLPSFINHRNDMVTKQSFLPNFQAWFLVFHNATFST